MGEKKEYITGVLWPEMDEASRVRKLCRPKGQVDVVLDTDTYNEIDDQFALSYLLKSKDRLSAKAIYAAPFWNQKSDSPADGMEKSYQEIQNILALADCPEYMGMARRGSCRYLENERQPVDSPAARDLVERAMARPEEDPLYVVAIGAITNVASALLLEPELVRHIVVIWLGGHARHWPDNAEFNLMQDVAAARVVFGCGVPLVQLPCMGVVSQFATTGPELTHWLGGKNRLCDYLLSATVEQAARDGQEGCWSRAVWDVAAVAWLLDEAFMRDSLEHSWIPEYDLKWGLDRDRHLMKYVYWIDRDRLFADLFAKLTQ